MRRIREVEVGIEAARRCDLRRGIGGRGSRSEGCSRGIGAWVGDAIWVGGGANRSTGVGGTARSTGVGGTARCTGVGTARSAGVRASRSVGIASARGAGVGTARSRRVRVGSSAGIGTARSSRVRAGSSARIGTARGSRIRAGSRIGTRRQSRGRSRLMDHISYTEDKDSFTEEQSLFNMEV
jgi:hypothetical protein